MRILVVVQARVGSSRLPRKVLLPVGGVPLLAAMLQRVQAARTRFELCVATTRLSEDDEIVELCRELQVDCLRGHPTDCLDRHLEAAERAQADAIVKIPSDCPLIEPAIIDRVLQSYCEGSRAIDYVSNLHPATYPDGNDVEVMSHAALAAAWCEARRPFEREHTTPFIWERPERFRLENVVWETGLDYSMRYRLTLDYPEDFALISVVFAELGGPRVLFGLSDVLELLERKPEIRALNARYVGVNWYRHHLTELKRVRPEETRSLENT